MVYLMDPSLTYAENITALSQTQFFSIKRNERPGRHFTELTTAVQPSGQNIIQGTTAYISKGRILLAQTLK